MRYGFTGTKEPLDTAQKVVIKTALAILDNPTEFTTGACVGVDAYVAVTAIEMYPHAKHRVIVPSNRKHVDYWWHPIDKWIEQGIDLEVILMPTNTDYRDRNERIVDFTDELLVFAWFPETDGKSKRSGTWMTKRIAERRGIRVCPPYVFSELCTLTDSDGNVRSMNDERTVNGRA